MIRAMKPPSKTPWGDKMPTKKYRVSPQVVMLRIDAIEVPPWARKIPREYLEESTRERGIIAPIVVGRIKQDKEIRLILIDGAGRLEMAKARGDEEIPARLVDISSEEEALLLSIELEQTKEPWSLEYTLEVIQELLNRGYSKQEIAEILKIPRSKLYRLLWIMEIGDKHIGVYDAFLDGKLPLRAADDIKSLIKFMEEKAPEKLDEVLTEIARRPHAYQDIVFNAMSRYSREKVKFEEEEEEEELKEKIVPPIEEEEEEIEEIEVEEEEKPETIVTEEEMEEELKEAEELRKRIEEKPSTRLVVSAHNKILSAIDDLKHVMMLLADEIPEKPSIAVAISRLEGIAQIMQEVLEKWGIKLP